MLVRKYDWVTPVRVGRVTISCWATALLDGQDIDNKASRSTFIAVNVMSIAFVRIGTSPLYLVTS
jgi:hypothetical protein